MLSHFNVGLQGVYPEHQHIWKTWQDQHAKLKERGHKPYGYWKDVTNQRKFFDRLAIKLNIQKQDDWYRVTRPIAVAEGGHFINSYYKGSLIRGLTFTAYLILESTSGFLP
jgi:hypothetical protein